MVFVFVLLAAASMPSAISLKPSITNRSTVFYGEVLEEIDFAAVKGHLQYLSALGSRMTGYNGCDLASDYIHQKFSEYGLVDVSFDEFNVTVPVDFGANLTTNSPVRQFKIYPMAPNLVIPVTTPPGGIMGQVIYVGDGHLSDFNGKKVNGSIVLMNFNSGWNWLNAAKLGAKAVIFIAPEDTVSAEAGRKTLGIPFNFPRFYMEREDAEILLQTVQNGNISVSLSSRMCWRVKTGRNVLGYVEGTENPNQIIMLSAYYDSSSIVPSLAPGAEDATGVSVLLELARFFSNHPPKYTILFVAFSGHYQGLRGSRSFLEKYFFGERRDIGEKIILHVNLDLSTGSKILALTNWGGFSHGASYIKGSAYRDLGDYFEKIVGDINAELGKNYEVLNALDLSSTGHGAGPLGWYLPMGVPISDIEPFTGNNAPSFSLMTVYDMRCRINTPLDVYDKLDLDNLRAQVEIVFLCLYRIALTSNLYEEYLSSFSYEQTVNRREYPYTSTIRGQVTIYNTTTGWYTGVSNALLVVVSKGGKAFVEMTDERGFFRIPHLQGGTETWVILSAFKLNETTGNLIYAPDSGVYKYASPVLVRLEPEVDVGFYTVFKCGAVVLFDLMDPSFLQIPPMDGGQVLLPIYEHDTHSAPTSFGSSVQFLMREGYAVAALYLPSDVPIEILLKTGYALKMPLAFLINACWENPEGAGYRLKEGEQYVFTYTALRFAEDLYWVNEGYLQIAERYQLGGGFAKKHDRVRGFIEQAKDMLESRRYDMVYHHSAIAWAFGRDVYLGLRGLIEDSVNAIVYVIAMMLPFIFLFERLVFHAEGLKRILSLIGVSAFFIFLLSFLHPGFIVASNIMMVIVSFVIVILALPVVAVFFSIFSSAAKRLAIRMRGMHFAEISKGDAAVTSFSVGVENLRKRKGRLLLTLFSIIIVVMALVMFTSTSTVTLVQPLAAGEHPPYQGIYVKRFDWGKLRHQVGENAVRQLRTICGEDAIVTPRAWVHPINPANPSYKFTLSYKNRSITFHAMVGMTPEEVNDAVIRSAVIAGRWFLPTDRWTCMLTEKQAERLGITELPAEVTLLGRKFIVTGVVNGQILDDIEEMDGEAITPLDATQEHIWSIHFSSEDSLIIGYRDALLLGGKIVSVSAKFSNSSLVSEAVKAFSEAFPGLAVYSGVGDFIYLNTKMRRVSIHGLEMQFPLLVISTLILLNLMLGVVYERRREISTYSCLGLSPLHIAFMFLSESLIYALVGGFMGYAAAMIVCKFTLAFSPEGFTVNYASSWVMTALGTAMAITVLSAIYPTYLASRRVTPSLERVWKIPTKPGETEWDVPLPFKASTEEEAGGVLAFLAEFAEGHGEGADVFWTTKTRLSEGVDDDIRFKRLEMEIRLAPYERGVMQSVHLIMSKGPKEKRWSMRVRIRRMAGTRETWVRLNRPFLTLLRRQMLIWRSLSPEDRELYIKRRTGGN